MKTFLNSAGILLIAAGASTLILFAFSSGLVVIGLTPELSAVLAIGGLLSIAASGIIAAIERQTLVLRGGSVVAPAGEVPAPAAAAAASGPAGDAPSFALPPARTQERTSGRREPFGGASASGASTRQPDEALVAKFRAVAAAAGGAVAAKSTAAQPAAKQPAATEPEEPPTEVSEEDLYVVEERVISGCPARILSDGTVEAETDDGWMRFENTEHLEEYLDGSRG